MPHPLNDLFSLHGMCGKKVHLSADPSLYTTLAFGPGVTLTTAHWYDYLVLPSIEFGQVAKSLKLLRKFSV